MLRSFQVKSETIKEIHTLFTETRALIKDKTELGFGFRKQLVDELNDTAHFCSYTSYARSSDTAFPDIASALISYVKPSSLVSFSRHGSRRNLSQILKQDERGYSDLEIIGREKAIRVYGAFFILARFMRSPKFWKLHVERRETFEALDAAYFLFARLGREVDKIEARKD